MVDADIQDVGLKPIGEGDEILKARIPHRCSSYYQRQLMVERKKRTE